MIANTVLTALLMVAAATDLRQRKIYNWTTYPGIATAVALNAMGSLLTGQRRIDSASTAFGGLLGIDACLSGLAVCGGILLLCYGLFRVGGGDVKMIAMIGAFLGPERGIEVMLWTFVVGGCIALITLVWRGGAWTLIATAGQTLVRIFMPCFGSHELAPGGRRSFTPLHLAPSALVAAILVQWPVGDLFGQQVGW
jgi:prepilin peptidase CpaA